MFQPLAGLRVVDLTQVLAGPYAAYQLGLLGAEVLKIEAPGLGDWSRHNGCLPELNETQMGLTYLTQNANKKSVTLNLKTPEGLAILKRLIAGSEVFIENFRPGTIARLGLPFEVVKELNPRIVYCSISAFGQDGAMSRRPAYDHVVQGMCGIMKTTGTPETGPLKVGAPYVDYATGLNAAFAIVSALHETRRSGEAVQLDVAMLDTSMLLMASLLTSHLTGGWLPKPSGNEAWSQSPSSGAFETADGLLMIAANNDRQFRALCAGISRPDILEDPRWASPEQRALHAGELRSELVATFRSRPAVEWEEALDAAGVPAAMVRSLDQLLAEDHARTRRFTERLDLPGAERAIDVPTLGFKVDGDTVAPAVAPPLLGQDTGAVLRNLGYSEADLRRLEEQGVI
ncbi:Crotonobetainyl-CoA:carnitine CoA-transferase CaiB [Tistlia consotensis]|uniref:Crotonobetainyl-CoA:carnitine CoA-transferase CaiB n=1 Tax=Tistlia consotensis USBA 355 TaxID=560819 RepID=A0A1Y6CAX4_9PROT|nr:CoA transferase [Tistlia consotensis]SMF52189.1 Crotonobetainyl-CoA:carnitine CoA-transferase CaiB [Tistlia consotensis USBA 355]SNR83206.1 Crotonobetainyl-CoA:carnitine CoA-transferase CaiB [Tistlia consotensis]